MFHTHPVRLAQFCRCVRGPAGVVMGDLPPPTRTGKVFHNLQCQMRFLHSCLHLTPETIPSNIPRGGQWAWATHVLCTVPALLGNVRFCTWRQLPCFDPLMASLQGGLSDSACVLLFILPLKDDISVYRRCLCQVQLVGLVCLLPFFFFSKDQGLSLLCSWSQWPTGNMPSSPEGHYTATTTNMTQCFFKHHQWMQLLQSADYCL